MNTGYLWYSFLFCKISDALCEEQNIPCCYRKLTSDCGGPPQSGITVTTVLNTLSVTACPKVFYYSQKRTIHFFYSFIMLHTISSYI